MKTPVRWIGTAAWGVERMGLPGMLLALALLGAWSLPRPARAQDDATCMMCHASASLFKTKPNPNRYVVTQQSVERSVHGVAGMGCTTCHGALGFPHPADRAKVDCASCHRVQGDQHHESLHGQAAARADPMAPTCEDCHGVHEVRAHTDPLARTAVLAPAHPAARGRGKILVVAAGTSDLPVAEESAVTAEFLGKMHGITPLLPRDGEGDDS